MTKFSGSFSGTAAWQTSVTLKDQPHHDMILGEIAGPQKTSDPNFANTRITYWSTLDLVAGNGQQIGYFLNAQPNGDTNRGSFQSKVRTDNGVTTLEGAWKFEGGTGKFKGITGNGTHRGRLVSPTQVEMDWEGQYELSEQ